VAVYELIDGLKLLVSVQDTERDFLQVMRNKSMMMMILNSLS